MPLLNLKVLVTAINLASYHHDAYYVFDLAGYRDRVSFNAFFNRGTGRNRSTTHIYYAEVVDELEACGSTLTKMKLDAIKANPPVQCQDLWDLYRRIGYDHKARSWA